MSTEPNQKISDSPEQQPKKDLKVIQEFVYVDKQTVETGKVIAVKTVKQEVADMSVMLNRDDIKIERIAIGQDVESAPATRYEGDTLIIPVVKEELVIKKRLVLVEEIRITKGVARSEFTEQVTLRKEEVEVKHVRSDELKKT